jgi:hypothetical protein
MATTTGIHSIPPAVALEREVLAQGVDLAAWCEARGFTRAMLRAALAGEGDPHGVLDELADTLGVSPAALRAHVARAA